MRAGAYAGEKGGPKMEAIGELLFSLLAIVGVCTVCRLLLQRLYRTGAQGGVLTLSVPVRDTEDLEFQVRAALCQLRELPGRYARRQLFLIDAGLSAEARAVCEKLLEREPCAVLLTRAQADSAFAKTASVQYTRNNS